MLVTSNFSFSQSVFKRLVLQIRKNQGMFGKGLSSIFSFFNNVFYPSSSNFNFQVKSILDSANASNWTSLNPFPNKPLLLSVCNRRLLKTMQEKEKFLITSYFSFSHIVFYPFEEFSAIFVMF